MKLRSVLVILVAATLGATLVGCGGEADVAKPTNRSSSDSGNSGDPGNSSDSGESGSSNDDPSASVPDPSDLAPLLGEDCSAVATAYAASLGMVFASPDEADQMRDELAKIKDQVPEDIAKDIAVINEAFAAIAKEGILAAGEKMDSQEFTDASERLEAFFTNGCK